MWYLMRRRDHKGAQRSRTRCCCAHCGASGEHEMVSCIVTVQNGGDEEMCVVKQAEYPPWVNCKSVTEALIMSKLPQGWKLPWGVCGPAKSHHGSHCKFLGRMNWSGRKSR